MDIFAATAELAAFTTIYNNRNNPEVSADDIRAAYLEAARQVAAVAEPGWTAEVIVQRIEWKAAAIYDAAHR